MEYDEVSILPDHLDVRLEAPTYEKTLIVLGVLGAIIVFGLLVWGLVVSKNYFYIDLDNLTPPPPPGGIPKPVNGTPTAADNQSNVGVSENGIIMNPVNGSALRNEQTCNVGGTRTWFQNRCACRPPFWGSECEREAHGNEYYGVGNYQVEGKSVKVNRKAFPYQGLDKSVQSTCEDLCNRNNECIGYQYENDDPYKGLDTLEPKGTCVLLKEVPSGYGEGYNASVDSNTYLVKTKRPRFDNNVFVYGKTLPLRFWLGQDQRIVDIGVNRVSKIDWKPLGIVNDGGHHIFISSTHFTIEGASGKNPEWSRNPDRYIWTGGLFNPPHSIVATGKPFWMAARHIKDRCVADNRRSIDSKTPTDVSKHRKGYRSR